MSAEAHIFEVAQSRSVFQGRVLSLRSDDVVMPGGVTSQRDVVELPGAVAIVALDHDDRVLLVRQYRHPVGRPLWEVPAGLLDDHTETPVEAGSRELFEEGHLRADEWWTLVDLLTSPGMTDETIRVLLARGLHSVPEGERHEGFHEEAALEHRWLDLDDAAGLALLGELENGITVAGLLAAQSALARGLELRPATAPWLARK